MLPQGILSNGLSWDRSLLDMPGVASSPSVQNIGTFLLTLACCHNQPGENALKRHGEGHCVGIPPLRARDSSREKDSRGAAVGMTDAKGLHSSALVWSNPTRRWTCGFLGNSVFLA